MIEHRHYSGQGFIKSLVSERKFSASVLWHLWDTCAPTIEALSNTFFPISLDYLRLCREGAPSDEKLSWSLHKNFRNSRIPNCFAWHKRNHFWATNSLFSLTPLTILSSPICTSFLTQTHATNERQLWDLRTHSWLDSSTQLAYILDCSLELF